ncbi:MAG: hypothetical protein HDQ96_01275 [Lachnospiraceae bacterium]|nr:hypothetical protein [Lachnospiraceae bacterium]
MQIKGIGVNTAGMMTAERGIQESQNLIQLEDNMFGPEYEVTISEEGRNLSEQQASQAEMIAQNGQLDEDAKALLLRLEETQLAKKTRGGYQTELDDIEKQIKVLNAAYDRIKEEMYTDKYISKNPHLKSTIEQQKETVEQLRELKEQMQELNDLQAEEAERRLRAAQQMAAMHAAQSMEKIDENNRNLVALLKTVEEAQKAEDEQETGGPKDGGEDASDTGNGTSDAIHNSMAGFVASSLNREKGVEELSNGVAGSGRGFLDQANDIAQDLLKKSASIKEAIDDKSFTNEQIEEMMQSFRSEVEAGSEEAYLLGSFGTQAVRDMLYNKIERIADNPLQSMQQIKDGMMQAAVNAALSEARQSSLDKTSGELADEAKELIDKRNGVDRIVQDNEENEGEQQAEQEKE